MSFQRGKQHCAVSRVGRASSGDLSQLLIIELAEERWSHALERWLARVNPGGIILRAQHLGTERSRADLLRKLAIALPITPLLALDHGDSGLDPLQALFPPLPPPSAVAQKGPTAVERLGELIGSGLSLLGFNMSLALLLDLSSPGSESRHGRRVFGSDPHLVARCSEAFVRGLSRHGILACGKNFPGLDNAGIQPNSKLRVIEKSMAKLWREDLVPYRRLSNRLPMVMVSYAAYKAYDFDLPCPAIFSEKVVEGLLRIKLGYRGVALANLDTEVTRRLVDPREGAVGAVNAGCDLVIVGSDAKCIDETLAALKRAVVSGGLSSRRVEQALTRIRQVKKCLVPPSGKLSGTAFLDVARQIDNFSAEFRSLEQKIA